MIVVIKRVMASTAKFISDDSELPEYLGLKNMFWELFLVSFSNLIIVVYYFRRDESLELKDFFVLLNLHFEKWSEILSLK